MDLFPKCKWLKWRSIWWRSTWIVITTRCQVNKLALFNHYQFTALSANSADHETTNYNIFLIFPENRIWHCMQIVSTGDNLHEMSNPVFWGKKKKLFQNVVCWKLNIVRFWVFSSVSILGVNSLLVPWHKICLSISLARPFKKVPYCIQWSHNFKLHFNKKVDSFLISWWKY